MEDGWVVGLLGVLVGCRDGLDVGKTEDWNVGNDDGCPVGLLLGEWVKVGDPVGLEEG